MSLVRAMREAESRALRHARGCVELARQVVDDIKHEDLSLDDARRIHSWAREAEGWLEGARRLLDLDEVHG